MIEVEPDQRQNGRYPKKGHDLFKPTDTPTELHKVVNYFEAYSQTKPLLNEKR